MCHRRPQLLGHPASAQRPEVQQPHLEIQRRRLSRAPPHRRLHHRRPGLLALQWQHPAFRLLLSQHLFHRRGRRTGPRTLLQLDPLLSHLSFPQAGPLCHRLLVQRLCPPSSRPVDPRLHRRQVQPCCLQHFPPQDQLWCHRASPQVGPRHRPVAVQRAAPPLRRPSDPQASRQICRVQARRCHPPASQRASSPICPPQDPPYHPQLGRQDHQRASQR
jgi:hypothetical protein